MNEEKHEAARVLYELEMGLWEVGLSKLRFDEEHDRFVFPDGRFAFSREMADWRLLQDRGYAP
jgi:serine/threonine protein kinase HipA of HipAB toxin-antitoxin module